MEIKCKKLDQKAVIPSKGTKFSAGLDLTAITVEKIFSTGGELLYIEYDTKLAMEIPTGFAGFIFPRSSISKYNLSFATGVSVIDSDYRGSIKLRFRVLNLPRDPIYQVGDKVAQMIIMPVACVSLLQSEELSKTDRDQGGFGSTDGKTKNAQTSTTL